MNKGNSIALGTGEVSLVQQRDMTWSIEGDPYYAGAEMRKYYRRTDQMIVDIQTQYNIAKVSDQMEGLGYYLTEEEEVDGKIQMCWESL